MCFDIFLKCIKCPNFAKLQFTIYVASRGSPGALGGPCSEITLNCGCFVCFSGLHALDVPCQKHITKFVDVMSCMMSP